MIVELNAENFEEFINQNDKVIVKFWATWCAPCKAISPVYESLSDQSNIPYASVKIDDQEEIQLKYKIRTVPSFIAFNNGLPGDIFSKKVNASTLKAFISDNT